MNSHYKLLAATVPMLLMAACGGGDDSLDDRLDLADPKARFVHAFPLGPDLSLFRNDTAQADASTPRRTQFDDASASRYFDIETGSATWAVRTTASPPVQLGSVPLDAKRGNRYTFVAVPGASDNVLLIDDPYNKRPNDNDARVRVVNASFNAANIDVYITPASTDIATVGPNISTVGYKAVGPASGNDSLEFAAGTYQVRVTTFNTKNVIFTSPVVLGVNADLLLVTQPATVSPSGVKLLVVQSDEGTPTVTEFESQ